VFVFPLPKAPPLSGFPFYGSPEARRRILFSVEALGFAARRRSSLDFSSGSCSRLLVQARRPAPRFRAAAVRAVVLRLPCAVCAVVFFSQRCGSPPPCRVFVFQPRRLGASVFPRKCAATGPGNRFGCCSARVGAPVCSRILPQACRPASSLAAAGLVLGLLRFWSASIFHAPRVCAVFPVWR
jgi:hypothetical protein